MFFYVQSASLLHLTLNTKHNKDVFTLFPVASNKGNIYANLCKKAAHKVLLNSNSALPTSAKSLYMYKMNHNKKTVTDDKIANLKVPIPNEEPKYLRKRIRKE
uniref:Uncharacterized protein n=1 Tax=Octopus bimaculoides TaxID=37653 RepID=A0A0L8HUV6_OCTBM